MYAAKCNSGLFKTLCRYFRKPFHVNGVCQNLSAFFSLVQVATRLIGTTVLYSSIYVPVLGFNSLRLCLYFFGTNFCRCLNRKSMRFSPSLGAFQQQAVPTL